jgi:hypothetical protein
MRNSTGRWTALRAGATLMLVATLGCGLNRPRTISETKMAALWDEPADLERRDLVHGAGGRSQAPNPNDQFEFLSEKETGTQSGYDVKDGRGREWSVKLGTESRIEVVVSRIVWAVGYHQPYIYYLPRWTLVRDGKRIEQRGARFRLEPPTHKKTGEWSWRSNPFLGTREIAGLLVLMIMVNNWDLKSVQNSIYQVNPDTPAEHDWYMVRDLGAALGKSGWATFGTKDDPLAFAQEPFIKKVEGNRVRFGHEGAWMEPQLLTSVTPADLRWISGLLSRLSAEQWRDAFRAGGYPDAESERFIRRLRQKVSEGMNIGSF